MKTITALISDGPFEGAWITTDVDNDGMDLFFPVGVKGQAAQYHRHTDLERTPFRGYSAGYHFVGIVPKADTLHTQVRGILPPPKVLESETKEGTDGEQQTSTQEGAEGQGQSRNVPGPEDGHLPAPGEAPGDEGAVR